MTAFLWPDSPPATPAEILDRARLVSDLDDATDPHGPSSVLVVVGLPRSPSHEPNVALPQRVWDQLAELLAAQGSIYRTRAGEICGLLDVSPAEFEGLLEPIAETLRAEINGVVFSVGFVTLPAPEALDAAAALRLADHRLFKLARQRLTSDALAQRRPTHKAQARRVSYRRPFQFRFRAAALPETRVEHAPTRR
jgi:hypothetical protein